MALSSGDEVDSDLLNLDDPKESENRNEEARQTKPLKVLRGIAKGQVTKLKNYIFTKGKEANIFELETKLGLLENYLINFNIHQSKLELLDEAELKSDERQNFEDTYFLLKSKLLNLIDNIKPKPSFSLDTTQLDSTISSKYMPSIKNLELPKFSGEITDWLDFWSSFSKLVDENEVMSDAAKFQHLKGCLTGKAKNIIKSIDNFEQGYKEAIDLLKSRYFNKNFLFNSHITSILDIQAISKPTVESIRGIADVINGNLRSLLTIGNKSQVADALLLKLVSPRLDRDTQIKWEEYVADKYNNNNESDKALVVSIPEDCLYCKASSHDLQNCKGFKLLSPFSRYLEIKKLRLCILCFKAGHTVKQCHEKKCIHCSGNHHNLLHRKPDNTKFQHNRSLSKSQQSSPFRPTTISQSLTSESSSIDFTNSQMVKNVNSNKLSPIVPDSTQERKDTLISNSDNRQVILPTALVNVVDSDGKIIQCRALLDSASQSNFVTKDLIEKLKLKTTSTDTIVSGIGNISSSNLNRKTSIMIQSRTNRFSATIESVVIDKITGLQPHRSFDSEYIKIPNNICLADPYFNVPNEIDLLIGADLFWKILCVGQIRNNDDSPIFQKTMFGWIVSGAIINHPTFTHCCITTTNKPDSLENLMQKFWDIENIDDETPKPSVEHLSCEQHFKSIFSRDKLGRCIVKLPLHSDPILIGDSYNIALKRFLNLERKLNVNSKLKEEYTNFLQEYLELNHMELIRITSINPERRFFLPHHCVSKLDSSSTKYRVVFDGSCQGTGKRSLNDLMLNGPVVQEDLFSILLRFRTYKFVLAADIVKMYRQIWIDEADRNLQCILWRDKPEDDIKIYRLKTVTYGTKAASFLAIRSLIEIAKIYSEALPLGSKIILKDFYVDNLLTGSDSLEKLRKIKDEVVTILNFGQFPLKKWASNSNSILKDIPYDDQEPLLKFQDDNIIKALGLNWNPMADHFIFYYSAPLERCTVSKRTILSEIARFFDPLGLINPVITSAKLFQQHLWKIKLDWDESLPMDLYTQWNEFSKQLALINGIRIKRHIAQGSSTNELHCFADASEKAYGACMYLRNIDINGLIHVHLMCAKSKVAPLKTITLARLELCASLLLCRLLQKVKLAVGLSISKIYCWSDSTIALAWIGAHSYEFSTFVANRITRIQELSHNCTWKHCPTELNPADLISRGATPQKLMSSKLWFNGPDFLLSESSKWPSSPTIENKDIPEKKKLKFSFISITIDDEIGSHKYINNYFRILRIFAYVTRFIRNTKLKDKNARKFGELSLPEIERGLSSIIKNLQRIYFSVDFNQLKQGVLLKANSRIRCLNPFLDEHDIIRVGGRIKYSNLPFSAKHQILLPNAHPFIYSLINYYHKIFCHAGCQNLLNIIREKFWIINGKAVIRKVLHQCLACFKINPTPTHQLMGDLPRDRVVMQRPFLICGVDYCGPFLITHRIRGRPSYKCYISIFICFSTKAVHMELVTDLTTNSFLAALKRFFARRGKAAKIYSDNGTNFKGTHHHLQELSQVITSKAYNKSIHEFCLQSGIEWRFIPPRSPHWGGLWESAVKIAKLHLYKICGNHMFTYEEFYTLICQVEMVMNSRPISPLSNDPNDYSAISPGHFLIGEPMVCVNYPPLNDASTLSDRYKNIQAIYQKFWTQWKKGYLNNLQNRQKWTDSQRSLKVNDLVLLIEENTSSMKWPLGRVTYVHPSRDNKVRVVSVTTASGTFIRSINKLCRLPVESGTFQGGQNEEVSN